MKNLLHRNESLGFLLHIQAAAFPAYEDCCDQQSDITSEFELIVIISFFAKQGRPMTFDYCCQEVAHVGDFGLCGKRGSNPNHFQ